MTPSQYVQKIAADLETGARTDAAKRDDLLRLVEKMWKEHLPDYSKLSVEAAEAKWRPILEAARTHSNADELLKVIAWPSSRRADWFRGGTS